MLSNPTNQPTNQTLLSLSLYLFSLSLSLSLSLTLSLYIYMCIYIILYGKNLDDLALVYMNIKSDHLTMIIPFGWNCRIRQVHLCRGVWPPPPTCVLDMTLKHLSKVLDIWGMWSTPTLPLLSDLLCPEVVVPVRIPFMDQIEL